MWRDVGRDSTRHESLPASRYGETWGDTGRSHHLGSAVAPPYESGASLFTPPDAPKAVVLTSSPTVMFSPFMFCVVSTSPAYAEMNVPVDSISSSMSRRSSSRIHASSADALLTA